MSTRPENPPEFDQAFRAQLEMLFRWRRDVRRFKTDPVPEALLMDLLQLACLSPSVGNSQPWRFVRVLDPARRAGILEMFERCNAEAESSYPDELARQYAALKLAGLREAPEQLAVFADAQTTKGKGLGRRTMPETLHYSALGSVMMLWLAARAHGLGVGWVSILEPGSVNAILDVPAGWDLVAYLCVGWPEEAHPTPELQRAGWENRIDAPEVFLVDR